MNDMLVRNLDPVTPYEFQEFPKWVTLADGSQELVYNAEEEAALTAPTEDNPPPATEDVEVTTTKKGKKAAENDLV